MIIPPKTRAVNPKTGYLEPDWLLSFVNQVPDRKASLISTSGGNVSKALPDAVKNLNTELVFIKTTSDGNTLTITGAQGGSVVLSTQGAKARFISDGNAKWWPI